MKDMNGSHEAGPDENIIMRSGIRDKASLISHWEISCIMKGIAWDDSLAHHQFI